jgi:hypothetical protein
MFQVNKEEMNDKSEDTKQQSVFLSFLFPFKNIILERPE